ncbi:hypothetical protein BESB_013490 [Besnoitia besnoiti]|uniref:Uncharacterized protein n=1 Tax=Besnoitia besnoiti TaxID=94643 RepID=A0A2A9MAT7_BESBE|nr:hypothetical protein BESB_013490 [Besnoitia besnoiti]PFH32737.1 hypothetical protein BESB_013490 [Besnoitia besnoiti]
MAQQPAAARSHQELPVSAPGQYVSTGPAFWSYHYDATPARRQGHPEAVSTPPSLDEPSQEHMNAVLAHALYNSIRENYSYILRTQYNYGFDKDGNVWAAQGYTPVSFAPERTKARML